MKKIISILTIFAVLFTVSVGSFALSKTETNLLKPYYGKYVGTSSFIVLVYEPHTPFGYVVDAKGLSIVEPNYKAIEKNGKIVIEKKIKTRFITGIKSVKKGKVKDTIEVVFGDSKNYTQGMKVTFTTKNKVVTMSSVFEDDAMTKATKMTLKDDAAFIAAYEKANAKQMKSELDMLIKEAQRQIEEAKKQKEIYANNLKAEEAFFEKIKSGAKVEFGEVEYSNITIENQTISYKKNNYETDKYDTLTYEITDVSRETKVLDEQSTEVTVTFKIKDGSVIKMSNTVTAYPSGGYNFIIGEEYPSFSLRNN